MIKRLLGVGLILAFGLNAAKADINITEGSGKVVAADSVSSTEFQKIKLCDGAAGSSTCFSTAPVSIIGSPSVTGTVTANQGTAGTTDWPVRLSTTVVSGTVTAGQGTAGTTDWAVRVASTVVNTGTKFLSVELSTGVTVNGTVTANISGSISNTSFAISTGGVTAAQGPAGVTDWPVRLGTTTANQGGTWTVQPGNTPNTTDWRVTMSTNAVTESGTWTVQPGNTPNTTDWRVTMATATVTQGGTWTVQPGNTANLTDWRVTMSTNAVTGTVTSNQGTASTTDWPVRLSTTVAAMQIQQSGGSLVGVGYQTSGGSIPVNVLNTVTVTGAISATSVSLSTAPFNQAFPGVGSAGAFVGPTGLTQAAQVDISSRQVVTVSTGGVTAAQGAAGVTDWPVRVSTVAIQTGTNNIGTVTGSTVTIYNPLGTNLNVNVAAGSISATLVAVTTGTWNQIFPGVGAGIAFVGPTGLTQAAQVDISSRQVVTVSTGGVTAAQGGTWTVQPGNTPNTTDWRVTMSSNTVSQGSAGTTDWPVRLGTTTVNQGTAGTTDWPVRVTSTVVNSGTTFLKVELSTGVRINTLGGSNLGVDFSTGVRVNTLGGSNLGIDLSTGVVVSGQVAEGVTFSGNPVVPGVEVTSTTIPTARSDGQVASVAGTNIGQLLVTGIPWGVIQSTYSTTISSSQVGTGLNGQDVLVSSPGASTYTYLCGCVFTNTTATNGAVVIESPRASSTNRMTIGVPANYVPAGVWPGCTNPFFRAAANSDLMIFQTVATSKQAVYMRCTYYNGP